jgi:transposase InsO family protein
VSVYPFIEAEKQDSGNVKRACELLKVSRAAFYAHRSGPCQRERQDADLASRVQAVHKESKGRYGAPRIHAKLQHQGHRHGRKRVARLMRQAGIAGLAARRWKKTTIADPAAAARADRIRRDFTADASKLNARWCGDITYIRSWEGWLFLATVIDIASRRVAGYALADDYPVVLSLGRNGQCWDNALAESFFASRKGELIDIRPWPTRAAARRAVVDYIGWYNGTRLHSTLGYRSPAQFEATAEKEHLRQVA